MKLLKKFLIVIGAIIPTIATLIFYATKKDNTIFTRASHPLHDNEFWTGKLKNFKDELLSLKKLKNGKEKELTEKIFGDNFFPEMEPQQKQSLYLFCNEPEREKFNSSKFDIKNLLNKTFFHLILLLKNFWIFFFDKN